MENYMDTCRDWLAQSAKVSESSLRSGITALKAHDFKLELSFGLFVEAIVLLTVLYHVLRAAYRLTLHPLAGFPGPMLWAVSHVPWGRWIQNGMLHQKCFDLHEKYGPVFRLTPDTLMFSNLKACDDIYKESKNGADFPKNEFYDGIAQTSDPMDRSMMTQRDQATHTKVRKAFAPNFSKPVLKQQEVYIQTHLATFMREIRARKDQEGGMDMQNWFNLLQFDITGDLAFGKPFGGLKSGEPHYWIVEMDQMFADTTMYDVMRRYSFFHWIVKPLSAFMNRAGTVTGTLRAYSRKRVSERLAKDPIGRTDFFSNVIKDGKAFLTFEQLQIHGTSIIIAGSPTVHTMFSMMYHLLKNPRVYNKLVAEIRSSFKSSSEITLEKVELPYLGAVIEESMRLYGAVTHQGYRRSPGRMVDGNFIPAGTEVGISPWYMTHAEEYWTKPWEFIPERWLTNEYNDTLKASLPFSQGPRVCIGRYFAMLVIRLVYCKLLFEFDVEPYYKEEFAKLDWVNMNRAYVFWDKLPLPVLYKEREIKI